MADPQRKDQELPDDGNGQAPESKATQDNVAQFTPKEEPAAPKLTREMLDGISVDEADEPYADLPKIEASLGLDVDETDIMEEVTPEESIDCRKPKKKEIFQVHPDPEMMRTAWVFVEETGFDKEYYLPTPETRAHLMDLLSPVKLYWCINTKGKQFIYPIGTEATDSGRKSRANKWWKTGTLAVKLGRKGWVSMSAGDDEYRVFRVRQRASRPDPVWPKHTMVEVLGKYFVGDRLIDSDDHPIMKEHGHRVQVTFDPEDDAAD